MNKASWIFLTLGVVGVITVILTMKKKCSCSTTLEVATAVEGDNGEVLLVDDSNNLVARSSSDDFIKGSCYCMVGGKWVACKCPTKSN